MCFCSGGALEALDEAPDGGFVRWVQLGKTDANPPALLDPVESAGDIARIRSAGGEREAEQDWQETQRESSFENPGSTNVRGVAPVPNLHRPLIPLEGGKADAARDTPAGLHPRFAAWKPET